MISRHFLQKYAVWKDSYDYILSISLANIGQMMLKENPDLRVDCNMDF